MKKITAVLVDDMPNALEMLANDIAKNHREITIIGTANSVVSAAKLLQKKQPDILFLDIMLGDGTGFDLLEIFPNLTSKIIFVTASDEYAIRAFKFAAIDYVLKPYSDQDLNTAIEKATIGEIDIQFYKILVEKEKLTLTVPINQQSKLRPIASINQINKCVSILKMKPKIKRTMWSRRAQEYDQKINSGKIYELAEVVRDLNKGDDLMVDQSYSERQLFEKAYERLKSEFEAVLNVSQEDVQKKMDKALGRTQISEQAE